jgi:lipoyl(octanoyl) transferase
MKGASVPEPRQEIQVCHLGIVPYREAVEIQERLRSRRLTGEIPDTLLLLEHPPTYTRGRRSSAEELPFPESFYEDRGAEVHATDRGGRITYHGPGQLVGYPIMAVTDVHGHLRRMEAAIIEALSQAGIEAHSRHHEGIDYTGVWVHTPGEDVPPRGDGPRGDGQPRRDGSHRGAQPGERKIASLGVHISRGISTHGFAVNVSNDLEPFSWVIPCGLPDVTMTSLAAETDGAGEGLACFRKRMAFSFARAHARRQRLVSPTRLGIAPRDPSPAAPGRPPENPVTEPVPA